MHDDFDFVFAGEFLIECGPAYLPHSLAVAEHFPKLFGEVRRHGREHQRQQLQNFLAHFGTNALFERLLRVNIVRQLHDERDRGIEMPSGFEVAGHAPQRLMHFAQQRFFFPGRSGSVEFSALHAAHGLRMAFDEPVNAVEESPGTLDAFFAPLQVFFRRRREKRVEAASVRTVFLRHLFRANDVATRFGHGHAAFLHHPLRKQPRNRFIVLDQTQVAHHFAPEARVQQVQNRMRNSADVLVDRKPVTHFCRVERRFVVVGVAVAVEIPRRVDERIHGVCFTTRRTTAFRTCRIHKLRR